jgi:murein DD-endopeptidase MepM/ murein hydrolase activator NlpD
MKQFLPKNPQNNTNWKLRITQKFWARSWFYKKYWLKGHEWIDINPKPWIVTPIYAVFEWNTYIRKWGAYWNKLDLYDDKGLVASYCHLSKILVKKGQRVKAGDLLWYSWNTANYRGMAIHLHFMIKECNVKTGAIYNERNWYLGSIPIKYDKVSNKLYIDTQKKYYISDVEKILDKWNDFLKSMNQEQAKKIKILEEKLKKINLLSK